MSIASVLIPSVIRLIPSDTPDGAATSPAGPRYSLLLTTDPGLVEAAQRLRYDVFTSTPGFALPDSGAGERDADRFDEFCDHLLVRDDDTGELVGCYRMLAPAGVIAAGGLYTATEFDLRALDPLRPSLVEMGRAVVRDGHRNGGVVLLMWAGILAYLDRYGYDYVIGCVSVPIGGSDGEATGSQLRGG
ncbi:GNAT family N-acetyltransferase, partial [Mycobacterium genavense]|uniref:GNAT family N-acetyltransferase n=1 Tax=Mycobacterium genavense TaxID=36812 RepID=UPI0004703393